MSACVLGRGGARQLTPHFPRQQGSHRAMAGWGKRGTSWTPILPCLHCYAEYSGRQLVRHGLATVECWNGVYADAMWILRSFQIWRFHVQGGLRPSRSNACRCPAPHLFLLCAECACCGMPCRYPVPACTLRSPGTETWLWLTRSRNGPGTSKEVREA